MTLWEAIATFVGIPALVVFLVALPIFGSDWWAWLRRRTAHRSDASNADEDRASAPD